MSERFHPGDYVTRISHQKDVLFRIEAIQQQNGKKLALLKGVDLRLCADAPLEDLVEPTAQEINRYRQVYVKRSTDLMRGIERRRKDVIGDFLSRAKINCKKNECHQLEMFELPGTVLHIDGDKEYLDLCLSTYRQLNIRATGFYESASDGIYSRYSDSDRPRRFTEKPEEFFQSGKLSTLRALCAGCAKSTGV